MKPTNNRLWLRLLAIPLLVPLAAQAHPLGNQSVNHFSVLFILPDRLEVDFLLDIAEMPSASIQQNEIDLDKDAEDSPEERKAWLEKKAVEFESLLHAELDGQPIPLKAINPKIDPQTGKDAAVTRVIIPTPGVAGMITYRLLIRYAGSYPKALSPGEHTITYRDTTFPQMPGLKRIILEKTAGMEFIPPHPPFWDEGPDPFIYKQYDPANLPDDKSVTVRFKPLLPAAVTKPAASDEPRGSSTQPAISETPQDMPPYLASLTDPRNDPAQTSEYYSKANRLITLLQGQWGWTMFLTVTLLSLGWGAAHALMPGHAKTVVAAYLISQRGTYWHAALLAVIVTVTHTALVVALGLVIFVYQKTHPNLGPQLQLWLGTIAGLLVAGMGIRLIWLAGTGRLGHHYDHHHHHDDRSWFKKLFTHSHPHPHDRAGHGQHLSTKLLLILGISGGIVPCPTATIIMLLGIAANVVTGALYAIAVFSLGLALTLMTIGFVALSSRKVAARLLADEKNGGQLSGRGQRFMLQMVPAFSGAVVAALGGAIIAHYLYMIQTGKILFSWMG